MLYINQNLAQVQIWDCSAFTSGKLTLLLRSWQYKKKGTCFEGILAELEKTSQLKVFHKETVFSLNLDKEFLKCFHQNEIIYASSWAKSVKISVVIWKSQGTLRSEIKKQIVLGNCTSAFITRKLEQEKSSGTQPQFVYQFQSLREHRRQV